MTTYDLVIVGGGVVGLTLAALLAKTTPLRVAIVEAGETSAEWHQDRYDDRVVALSPASMRILTAAGVWTAITAKRVSPYQRMHIWDEASAGELDFDRDLIGESSLGYIVEHNLLQQSLLEAIRQHTTITYYSATQLKAYEPLPDGCRLTTSTGVTLDAPLLMGADGRASWVREHTGMTWKPVGTTKQAIIATVTTTLPHEETAWQRFLADGPLALLPLANPLQSSIVWSLTTEEAARLQALPKADFCVALTRASEAKLGTIQAVGQRHCLSLERGYAKHYVQNRIGLMGDAAHVIHPLAGQGLNLGLMDAAYLAELLADAHAKGEVLTDRFILRRYERVRKSHNWTMMAFVETLQLLFSQTALPVTQLRGLGLIITNRIEPLKQCFVRYATGHYRDAPKVAQKMV